MAVKQASFQRILPDLNNSRYIYCFPKVLCLILSSFVILINPILSSDNMSWKRLGCRKAIWDLEYNFDQHPLLNSRLGSHELPDQQHLSTIEHPFLRNMAQGKVANCQNTKNWGANLSSAIYIIIIIYIIIYIYTMLTWFGLDSRV